MDIFPGEYVGNAEREQIFKVPLHIGDKIKVIEKVSYHPNQESKYGQIGTLIKTDSSDEWAYCLEFDSPDDTQWFKRYQLEKVG